MDKSYIKQKFKKLTGVNIKSIYKIVDNFDQTFDFYIINDAYVIRSEKKIKDPLYSIKNEIKIYSLLKNEEYCEKTIYISNTNGFKISRFIHNSIIKNNYSEIDLLKIAKQLKKIHLSQSDINLPFLYYENINNLKALLNKENHIKKELENLIIENVIKQNNKDLQCFSHNFLLNENILFKNYDIKIKNFQYGTKNSIFYDLSFIINENDLNDNQIEYFLKKYFGYKFKKRYKKIIKIYSQYQNLLNYYYFLYLFTKLGEIFYLDLSNNYHHKLFNS